MKAGKSSWSSRKNLWIGFVLVACALLLLRTVPPGLAQGPVTVLRGGTLIDGTGAPPMPNAVIVVRRDHGV